MGIGVDGRPAAALGFATRLVTHLAVLSRGDDHASTRWGGRGRRWGRRRRGWPVLLEAPGKAARVACGRPAAATLFAARLVLAHGHAAVFARWGRVIARRRWGRRRRRRHGAAAARVAEAAARVAEAAARVAELVLDRARERGGTAVRDDARVEAGEELRRINVERLVAGGRGAAEDGKSDNTAHDNDCEEGSAEGRGRGGEHGEERAAVAKRVHGGGGGERGQAKKRPSLTERRALKK